MGRTCANGTPATTVCMTRRTGSISAVRLDRCSGRTTNTRARASTCRALQRQVDLQRLSILRDAARDACSATTPTTSEHGLVFSPTRHTLADRGLLRPEPPRDRFVDDDHGAGAPERRVALRERASGDKIRVPTVAK